MSRSGGDVVSARTWQATRNSSANAPNHGLDHVFEGEMGDHEKDDVIRDQQLDPRARLVHHVAGEQGLGGLYRREQDGDEHREQQQRQEHLARPAPAGHRRVESAQRDDPDGAEREHAEERRPPGGHGHLEQDDADHHDDDEHQPDEGEIREQLSGKDRPPRARIEQQRLKRAALEFHLVRAVEREHRGEECGEPEDAGGGLADRLRVRSQREAEQDEDRDAERDDAVESGFRAAFRGQVFPGDRAHAPPIRLPGHQALRSSRSGISSVPPGS
jgi:hypothetical protein